MSTSGYGVQVGIGLCPVLPVLPVLRVIVDKSCQSGARGSARVPTTINASMVRALVHGGRKLGFQCRLSWTGADGPYILPRRAHMGTLGHIRHDVGTRRNPVGIRQIVPDGRAGKRGLSRQSTERGGLVW